MGGPPPFCQVCYVRLPLPPLDPSVGGVQIVLDSNTPKMRLCCPHCADFLTVSPEVAGHRRRCPACRGWFRLDLMKEGAHADRGEAHSPAAEAVTAGPVFVDVDNEPSLVSSPASQPEAFEPKPKRAKSPPPLPWQRSPLPPRETQWVEEDDFEADEEDGFPVLVEPDEPQYHRHESRHSGLPALPYHVIFRLLAWTLWIGFPLGCLFIAASQKSVFFGLLDAASWFLPGLKIPVRLANLIMSICFRWIRCAGCGESFPAHTRWTCQCGYTAPRERNLFHFRCPICRDYLRGFNCPQCESTILVK